MRSIYDEIYVARSCIWDLMMALIDIKLLPSGHVRALVFAKPDSGNSAIDNWHNRYLKVLKKEYDDENT